MFKRIIFILFYWFFIWCGLVYKSKDIIKVIVIYKIMFILKCCLLFKLLLFFEYRNFNGYNVIFGVVVMYDIGF